MATQDDLLHDLNNLHDQLKKGWQQAPNQLTENRILDIDEMVCDMITHLVQEDITADNMAFKALQNSMAEAQKDLTQLQDDIKSIISAVNVATSIANGIDTVLTDAVSLGLLAA